MSKLSAKNGLRNKMIAVAGALVSVLGASIAVASPATIPSPFSFNLVALGNVGTTSSPKTADVQGTAAIVGNLYGSGWSAGLDATSVAGYSLYVGGTAKFSAGSIGSNGMQVGGSLTLDNFGATAPIVSGGNLYGTNSGTLSGQVTLGGTNQSQLTITGTLKENQAFSPAFNPGSLTSYFDNLSTAYSVLPPTVAANQVVNQYSTLTINATSGVQVVDLAAGTFGDQTSVNIKFSGGSDASNYLIINVPDSSLTLNYLTFSFSGISASHVLVNALGLTSLTLNSGGNYNLLAPSANTDYTSGSFQGNLIVDNLTGGGESDLGNFFTPPPTAVATPEPAAIALLAVGALGLLVRRKKVLGR